MEPTNLSELFTFTPTKREAVQFLDKLSSIVDSLYDIKTNLSQKIDQTLSIQEKQILLAYCQKNNIKIQDPPQFQKLVNSLKNELMKIPVISLTLAISPTPVILQQIEDWLQTSFKNKFFLDIQIQPEIVGGIIISQNGKIQEYSLRKLFRAKFGNPNL